MKKLTILHSNDMHGDFTAEKLDEKLTGGVSMLSGYVDKVRREEKNTLYCIAGDMFRGIGLLILFGAMYAVRQFAEPRIVGETIGVHPFFMLIAVFAGFRLFGLGGVLLIPILLYVAKAAVDEMVRDL